MDCLYILLLLKLDDQKICIVLCNKSYLIPSREYTLLCYFLGVLWGFFLIHKFTYFIYLFLAAFGLRCCMQAFSNCGKRGLLFVVVCRLAVASLVAEHGL